MGTKSNSLGKRWSPLLTAIASLWCGACSSEVEDAGNSLGAQTAPTGGDFAGRSIGIYATPDRRSYLYVKSVEPFVARFNVMTDRGGIDRPEVATAFKERTLRDDEQGRFALFDHTTTAGRCAWAAKATERGFHVEEYQLGEFSDGLCGYGKNHDGEYLKLEGSERIVGLIGDYESEGSTEDGGLVLRIHDARIVTAEEPRERAVLPTQGPQTCLEVSRHAKARFGGGEGMMVATWFCESDARGMFVAEPTSPTVKRFSIRIVEDWLPAILTNEEEGSSVTFLPR